MTKKQSDLCERLKQMGFKHENQIRLYGQRFELQGEPMVLGDGVILMDAVETNSGCLRRIRIPLPIINMASREARHTSVKAAA